MRPASPTPRLDRSRGIAFGAMLLGGMLGLIAGAQPWWKASGGGASVSFTGSQASGGLTWALAAVVLAGVLLALVLRARGRRVVAAVIALAGIGMAVAGALRQRPTSDGVRSRLAEVTLADTFALTVTAWPWAYALAGVLVTGGAILMLVRAGRWPVRTARFDRAATGARSDLADDPTGAWRALDAGEDPTVSGLQAVGDDRHDSQPEEQPDALPDRRPDAQPDRQSERLDEPADSDDPDVQSDSPGDTMGSQGGSTTTRREPS